MENYLLEGERIDDLQREGLRIIQKKGSFCFSMDSVLLASFAKITPKDRIADLGTGTGILPLLLWGRYRFSHADAIEINAQAAERASRSVALNDLSPQINIIEGDLRNIQDHLPRASYDAVISNPPYSAVSSSLLSQNDDKRPARQETEGTLEQFISAASYLLRYRGHLFMMLPAARSAELIECLARHRFQPKRIRYVHSYVHAPARLILIDAAINGGAGVIVQPPLIAKNEDGTDSDEIRQIYAVDDKT